MLTKYRTSPSIPYVAENSKIHTSIYTVFNSVKNRKVKFINY